MSSYPVVLDKLGGRVVSHVCTNPMIRGVGWTVPESLLSLAFELLEMANFYKLMAEQIPDMEQESLLTAQTYIFLSQRVTEQAQRIRRQLSVVAFVVNLN